MKLIYKLFAAAASILALSSCVEDAIEPMTGKYEKPVVYEMNTLVSQSVEKGEKTRTFTIELGGNNASMTLKMVGDKYFLADGSYTPAAADQAKKNTYIVGNGGTSFNNIAVETGSIMVTQGEGTYTFAGILWLADESVIEIKSTVALVYEADPEPVKLTQVSNAYESTWLVANTITMELADAYLTFTPSDNGPIYAGSGTYLQLMLYSPDKYLHEGTYTASASGEVVNEGEFAIGFDAWGGYWPDAGTCLCTVTDGVKTAQKLSEGTVTVTKKGSKWVIEYICGEGKDMIWTKFEGAIEALTPQGSSAPAPEYTMTDKVEAVYDASYAVVAGVEKHIVTLTKGEEVAAIFELLTAENGVIEGTYECQEYASAAGLMGNGYSFPDYKIEGGSRYWVNGEMVLINPGETLEVAKLADGLYSFTGSTGYEFVAATSDYVAGGDNGDAGSDYVELTKVLGTVTDYYTMYEMPFIGIELATADVECTPADWVTTWWNTYSGNGNYLKLEIYSTTGRPEAGEYTACATGGTVGEGEFGIGYEGQYGASGTTWYTVAEGQTTPAYITDGTVTVEVDGDTYTITLESSTVNAQFVGTL